jgi:O-methyltransferase domain/Dimerisation domain
MSEQDFSSDVMSPAWHMMHLLWGLMPSRAVSVAAKLGIADLLANGPSTADELAQATGTHAGSLRRLLSALTSLQIFGEDASGVYRNTSLSETLRSDHPYSMRALAMLWGRPLFLQSWQNLETAIASGVPAFDSLYGQSFFEYLEQHPEDASIFNAAMSGSTAADVSAVLQSYDFSRFQQIVDVGGGHGGFLRAILSATPHLRGVLYDLPSVVAGVEAWGGAVAGRCEVRPGNFFEAVPEGADGYLLRRIIHDWDDEASLKILKNCRRAIASGGTLLIVERVLKPPNESDFGKFLDLHMFVVLGGRERSELDFRALLQQAGFSLTRIIPTAGPHAIIESGPL